MARGRSTAKKAEIAKRRADAIALRIRGETWETIARALSYGSPGAACQDVARAMKERLGEMGEQADSLRELERARLDALEAAAWQVLERRHVTVSSGKIVVHDGEPLEDDGPTLSAIDRVLRISERRSKLLGIDSPVKIEAGVIVGTRDSAIDKLRGMLAEVQTNRQETGEAMAQSTPAPNGNGHGGNGANGHG